MKGFHIGQRVVRVCDPDPHVFRLYPQGNWPQRDVVYTVRELGPASSQKDGLPLIRFEEIRNDHFVPAYCQVEPGFPQFAFRPVVETDIAIFQAMLNPTPADRERAS